VLEPNLLRLALRAKPDRTAPLRSYIFAGRRLTGAAGRARLTMQRLGRLGLASETAVIDLAAAAPAVQRRAVTRTATHAATPRAAWRRRCSPERWTGDSSPTSTVFPTDSAGAPPDSWRDKGMSRPRIEAAATFAAMRTPSTEREEMAMAEIAGTDASRALLIHHRVGDFGRAIAGTSCEATDGDPRRRFATAGPAGRRGGGAVPVIVTADGATDFRAATRVVSDPTAPQHHCTSAGLWFQSHGFQTLGYRPAELFRR
jgi:hypothetical protein